MNRREFCRNLALVAGGSALVLPEQIEAATRTLFLGSAHLPDGSLIGIHDLAWGFDCPPRDGIAVVSFFDGDRVCFRTAINMRGNMRLVLPSCDAIVSSLDRFHWIAIERRDEVFGGDRDLKDVLCGTARWIDTDGTPRTTQLQGRSTLTR